MNETVNKFLLAGDKFMPEMHLKQPEFTHSACCTFTKNKKEFKSSENLYSSFSYYLENILQVT